MQKRKIDSLLNWWQGIKQPPLTLEINPSKNCDLRCPFCEAHRSIQTGKKELPYREYKMLIENARSLGISQVRVLGRGEPFVRKDMLKIMRYIKKNKLYGFVCTNGFSLDKKRIKRLVKCGWDRIEISLHGSSSETHDKLVNKEGVFNKILENIRLINGFKTKYEVTKPFIGISTVLIKLNYKDIPNIVRLAHKIKANSVSLNPLIINSYNKSLKMTNKEIKEFKIYLEKSIKLVKKYNLDANYYNLNVGHIRNGSKAHKNNSIITNEKGILNPPCYFPWLSLAVDQDGYVSQCNFCKGPNSIKEKSLEEIWYGDWFEKLRKKIKKCTLLKECNSCCTPNSIENSLIRQDLITSFKKLK